MEYLGIFGVVALAMVWHLQGLPDELTKLKRRVAKSEKALSREMKGKGELHMSRLIGELKGKWCEIDSEDLEDEKVQICDVDEEWVKVIYQEKGTSSVQLIRIDSINSVKVLAEA